MVQLTVTLSCSGNFTLLVGVRKDSKSTEKELKSRLIEVQSQMRDFDFCFELSVAKRLYKMTENLPRALQAERLSALKGEAKGLNVITH